MRNKHIGSSFDEWHRKFLISLNMRHAYFANPEQVFLKVGQEVKSPAGVGRIAEVVCDTTTGVISYQVALYGCTTYAGLVYTYNLYTANQLRVI
jgi:hypothetical protein